MKIVVGLGNPGPKYETTRHNAGFLALDRLIERWKANGPVSKYQGELYQASFGGEKMLLVKPQTYMNLSGRCVAPVFNFYKCKPEDLIVIHDDLDLPPLAMKIKQGGGTGGHNGLKSLDAELGASNTNYARIRIGIGHPSALGLKISPVDYVLQQFSDDELGQLDPFLDRVASATEKILSGDLRGAMTEFNRHDSGVDKKLEK